MKQGKSLGFAGGKEPELITTALLRRSLAQPQLQELEELGNHCHCLNIPNQVLIPEILVASSRAMPSTL